MRGAGLPNTLLTDKHHFEIHGVQSFLIILIWVPSSLIFKYSSLDKLIVEHILVNALVTPIAVSTLLQKKMNSTAKR